MSNNIDRLIEAMSHSQRTEFIELLIEANVCAVRGVEAIVRAHNVILDLAKSVLRLTLGEDGYQRWRHTLEAEAA